MPRSASEAARIIGERIAQARQESGLTQQALGERSGIDTSNIGKHERGLALPSLSSVIRLADALGIDPAALIAGVRPEDLPERDERPSVREYVARERGVR